MTKHSTALTSVHPKEFICHSLCTGAWESEYAAILDSRDNYDSTAKNKYINKIIKKIILRWWILRLPLLL